MPKKPRLKLNMTIALFVCAVVALALLVADVFISDSIERYTQQNLEQRARSMAGVVANSPVVLEALSGQRSTDDIQKYTEKIRDIADVEFIVVMDMQRNRYSHPNPRKIGEYYQEPDANPAFAGRETASVMHGSLGVSMRAFAPIVADDGRQIGVVLVGIMLEDVHEAVAESRSGIYVGIFLGLVAGIFGALVLARRIKKVMFGLEPFAIGRLLEERNGMLQSVREGVIAVDAGGHITVVNHVAAAMLAKVGIQGPLIGENVEECVPNTRLKEILQTGQAELDQEQDLHGLTLLTNRIPIRLDGKTVGAIATFRDKTEVQKMAERLVGIQNYAEALRSQAHEFMNKLHVILGMVRMGYYDRINGYVSQIAQQYQAEVGSVVRKVKDPVLAGFILSKLSRAREAGIAMKLEEDSYVPEAELEELVHELITILGNIIENAFEALASSELKTVSLRLVYEQGQLTIYLADSGPGIPAALRAQVLTKGYSTKGENRGLGLYLTYCSVKRLGGRLEIADRPEGGTLMTIQLPYQKKEEIELD